MSRGITARIYAIGATEYLPIEPQLNGIQFLRNRDIISEEDYESLKNKLLGRSNKAYIGFGN